MTGPDVAPGLVPDLVDLLSAPDAAVLTLTLVYLAEYFARHALVAARRAARRLPHHRAGQGVAGRASSGDRHALRNALLPTVTLLFLNLGFVVTGAITVETVFSWPGLGCLSYAGAARAGHPVAARAVPGVLRRGDR